MEVHRPPKEVYRYKMIHHKEERLNPKNPKRFLLLDNWKFHKDTDGLNVSKYLNLSDGIYTVVVVISCVSFAIDRFNR